MRITTKINSESKEIILSSAYMDSTIPEIPNELDKLADNCCKNNIDLIIGTDSNVHHTLCGSKSPNTRGEMVLDFMVENILSILNRGTHPTFVTSRSETIIDLTLTRGSVYEAVKNWRVTNSITSSDHMQYSI